MRRQAPIHCPAEDHTTGSPRKRRPTARPERKRRCLGLSGNRLGFRSRWMDSRSAGRSLRNGACIAANVGRQSDRQRRLHCTSVDPAVRNAAGCGPSQRRRFLAQGSGNYLTPAEVLGLLASEAPLCGRYIRMQCIAPLMQAQLASSTRGLISIARRRRRHSLKLTVPGARSRFCSRHDTGRTLHAWQRIENSGAKVEARVRCGEIG
jgi:hypothetical protein